MRAFLRRAATLAAFVALLWAVQVVNWITGYGLNPAFGLIPRQLDGLDGVVAMPLMHGSFAHLMANTPPLLVMGGLLVATTTRALLPVNAVVIGLGGGLVWLFGSSAIHIGASGLVFGWFGFLVARGLVVAPRSRWARHWWSVSSTALFSGAFFRVSLTSRGRRICSALSRALPL